MLIRLFRSDVSYQILIILFLSGVLWFKAFANPIPALSSSSDLYLYNPVFTIFSSWPLLSVILAFILMIAEAIFLNLLLSSHELTPRNSALAAILYILLMSWSPEMLTINPLLICNAFLLAYLYLLLSVFEKKEAFQEIFSAAIAVSIASFFDITMAWLLILLFITMLVYRLFSWREWFISLFGFLIPYYFAAVYFFWNDKFTPFAASLQKIIKPHFVFNWSFDWISISFLIIFGVLMIWTMLAVLNIIQEKVIAVRKKYAMIIWFFIITLFTIPLASPGFSVRTTILFIPAASLLSYYFGLLKKLWIMEFIFGILVALILINRF